MIYDVVVTAAAEDDIAEAFAYIQARSPENAERWLRGLYKLVHKLESLPKRCGRAREADELGMDLRQLVFKSHRIVFRIDEAAGTVRVLRVFHGARLGLSREELDNP
ncbi:MAG: Plasmid stabilization system protein [Phycisphaerales bacterium]|nr:Plasmid stabilization system protein [Phycisphaerales bacterium]